VSARGGGAPSVSHYGSDDLDLFCHAQRWKALWVARVRPFVSGDVLEVGAGIGSNTALLHGDAVRSWRCLEPDPALAVRARETTRALRDCEVVVGTIDGQPPEAYDSILYVDVLEHVEDDRRETALAARCLRPGGRLVVLSPAHPSLYSPFDRAVGHHRRYDAASLRACRPEGCRETRLEYLDSAGLLLSWGNRALLRQSMPTLRQILVWDRLVVPVSRVLDPLLGRRVGKSILCAWTRYGAGDTSRIEQAPSATG
jgi:SAM-dependent methyltransferase